MPHSIIQLLGWLWYEMNDDYLRIMNFTVFQSLLVNEQTICLLIRWIFVFTKRETWRVIFGIFENIVRRIRGQIPNTGDDNRIRDGAGRFIRPRRGLSNQE